MITPEAPRASRTSGRRLQFHIGHHFFGAGNLGDDWMLDGFFRALEACGAEATFSCCTPFDRVAQANRFPQVEWLPYDPDIRRASIARADGWLGLGDTPFQSDTGTWFLEHLETERLHCREVDLPMWFVGVGVNDRGVFANPLARGIAASASRIWTRDARSAEWIAGVAGEPLVEAAADLSHAFFETAVEREPRGSPAEHLAMCVNFEDRAAFDLATIEALLARHAATWLVQEIRSLRWSEHTIHDMLSAQARARLTLVAPDYVRDSALLMLQRWGTPASALTSRYHAATAMAWLGVPTVAVIRNDKLDALANDLGLVVVASLTSADAVEHALTQASPVPRATLAARAKRARDMVSEWADVVGARRVDALEP